MTRRIRGDFCEKTVSPRGAFDRRSFRWVKSGRAWVLIGCPRTSWDARRGTCRVGTRAHKILRPTVGHRCPAGQSRVRK